MPDKLNTAPARPEKNGENGCIVPGLKLGTEYTFTVKSLDVNGNKSRGVSITKMLQQQPLDISFVKQAPQNGTVTIGGTVTTTSGGSITTVKWGQGLKDLAWFASSGRGTQIAEDEGRYSFEVTQNSSYTIYARDSNGWEGMERINVDSISQSSASAPGTPAGLAVSSKGVNTISLSWNSVSGAASYILYRSDSESGSYSQINEAPLTAYTDTNLDAETTYYYKVAAKNSNGTSPQSTSLSATTNSSGGASGNIPGVPTGLNASGETENTITLSWNSVSGAASYILYRSESESGSYSQINEAPLTVYTDTNLDAETTYYYKVAAKNSNGTSPMSQFTSGTTDAATGPSNSDILLKVFQAKSFVDLANASYTANATTNGNTQVTCPLKAGSNGGTCQETVLVINPGANNLEITYTYTFNNYDDNGIVLTGTLTKKSESELNTTSMVKTDITTKTGTLTFSGYGSGTIVYNTMTTMITDLNNPTTPTTEHSGYHEINGTQIPYTGYY